MRLNKMAVCRPITWVLYKVAGTSGCIARYACFVYF